MGTVPTSFYTSLLSALRAPVTAISVRNLQTWQRYEGGGAANNPLNSEWPMAGAGDYNAAGVKNYTSAGQGVAATAENLNNGRYTAIIVKLRTGAQLAQWNDPSVLEQIETWGTVGFANYIRTLTPTPAPKPPPIIKDDDMLLICTVDGNPDAGTWIFGNGNYTGLETAEDITALTPVADRVVISGAQHERWRSNYPQGTYPVAAPAAAPAAPPAS